MGVSKQPKKNPIIETRNMQFCKDLQGVLMQTTNSGMLLELGQTTTSLSGKKLLSKTGFEFVMMQQTP